jgi:hypothetical protein
VVAVATAGLAAACGGASAPTGLLEGTVTLGPITPVEQVGGGPNTRPYAAIVDVETPAEDVVKTVASGNDGTFSLRLAAGMLDLVAKDRNWIKLAPKENKPADPLPADDSSERKSGSCANTGV